MRNFQDAFETRKESFISPLSIYMTVVFNMLQVISASCSFSKTTTAYQIDILHLTLHPHFSQIIDGQTDSQADRQADRIDTQIQMCFFSLYRAVLLLFESLLAHLRFFQDQIKHETLKPPLKLKLWLCSLKVVVPEPRKTTQQ